MKETFESTYGKVSSLKHLQVVVDENSVGEKERRRIHVILERISRLSLEIEGTLLSTNLKRTPLNFTYWCIEMMKRDVTAMIDDSVFPHPDIYTTLRNFLSTKSKKIGRKVISSRQKRRWD